MKRRIAGVVVALGLFTLAGVAAVAVRFSRLPEPTAEDRARLQARVTDTARAIEATWARPPSREPMVEGDAGALLLERLPGELPDELAIDDALEALERRAAIAPEVERWLAANGEGLVNAARDAAHMPRATWQVEHEELAMRAALLLFLRAGLTATDTASADACLGTILDAIQITLDARIPAVHAYARAPLYRCLPLASPEARRDAARRIAHLVANERPFGIWVENSTDEWIASVLDEPQEPLDWRAPGDALLRRRQRVDDLGDARAALDHSPLAMRALSGACMPACVTAYQHAPSTTELERRALWEPVVWDARVVSTKLKLHAILIAFAAGDGPGSLARFTDPVDGAPMRSARVDGHLVVYSIGENGTDDHGGREDVGIRIPAALE